MCNGTSFYAHGDLTPLSDCLPVNIAWPSYVAEAAVLTTASPIAACSSPRGLSREDVESARVIDCPLLFAASPTLATRAADTESVCAARGTRPYAITSTTSACVSRGSLLLSKGVQGVAVAQRSSSVVHSFRKPQTLITNTSTKSPGNGVAGGAPSAVGFLGRTTAMQQSLGMDQHRTSGAMPTATVTATARNGTALAGIRTGPRTVTVVPVLSRYPINNSSTSPTQARIGGLTALYRTSSQTVASTGNSAATCLSGYATESQRVRIVVERVLNLWTTVIAVNAVGKAIVVALLQLKSAMLVRWLPVIGVIGNSEPSLADRINSVVVLNWRSLSA
ncbi:unnamed protein product [Toxocara canis]|uniref:Uncharacterized protein n=1 Tax=Toxocara canis TaxID=6265 RepID=A0A183TYR6_TOXCA|nr:unnamed protein product [Toxocara canis]